MMMQPKPVGAEVAASALPKAVAEAVGSTAVPREARSTEKQTKAMMTSDAAVGMTTTTMRLLLAWEGRG